MKIVQLTFLIHNMYIKKQMYFCQSFLDAVNVISVFTASKRWIRENIMSQTPSGSMTCRALLPKKMKIL